jgi:muconolactone delta-isomerase
MIYLIQFKVQYGSMGERLERLLPQELETTAEAYDAGILLGIWRMANAMGVVAIWDLPDHEAVHTRIRAMPFYPYLDEVEILPLIAHPRYPEFATAAGRRGGKAEQQAAAHNV